jgi:hypothetical protein
MLELVRLGVCVGVCRPLALCEDVSVTVLLKEIDGLLVIVPERVLVLDCVRVLDDVAVTSAVPDTVPVIVCDGVCDTVCVLVLVIV